jgi:serine/threonine-protein kinase PRP4
MKEIEILRELNTADPTGRYHCVRLLHQFEHAGHTCLVFEPLAMNLKELQDKFGTGVGLSIQGVQEFARQLLLSLALLSKLRIIHADIKPHNILSTESYRVIKLADFGSALRSTDETDVAPTPYMQSRFYRAPEVILGCKITAAIDIWSVACVLFELFTGHPLFPGSDNNDMLFKMQSTVGRISQKIIRRHLQHSAAMGLEPHFEEASVGGSGPRFRRRVKDPINGTPGIKLLDFTFVKATDEIKKRLDSARSDGDDKRTVQDLCSLLVCMLNPDPVKRISVTDALKHPFIERRGGGH